MVSGAVKWTRSEQVGAEWESKCKKCGECCRNGDRHCPKLIGGICSVYPVRHVFSFCMTVEEMHAKGKMPESCGYREVFNGAS